MLVRVQRLGHGIDMLPALVGEGRGADVRCGVRRRHVGDLGDVAGDDGQAAELLLAHHRHPHLQLEVGDEGAEVGVARALAVAVGAALDMGRTGSDRRQGVGDGAAGVVVAVDPRHRAEAVDDLCHHLLHVVWERSPAGVAEGDNLGAGLECRLQAAKQWWLGDRLVDNADILGYPYLMRVLRVRRIGNSNMVSIPKELEASGYTPGTEVLLEEMPDGALRLVRTEAVSALIRDIGRQVIAEDREALEILATHDRNDVRTSTR